jgi:hypothetical protein
MGVIRRPVTSAGTVGRQSLELLVERLGSFAVLNVEATRPG